MSTSAATAELNFRQRAGYHALRGVLFALRALSVRQCVRIGSGLGSAAFRFMKKRRRTVIHNLRIVFGGQKDWDECEEIAREVFRRTGANIIGGLRGGFLPSERRAEVVEMRGQQHARAALAEGRGVIVLLGHMGPWEILAQVGDLLFDRAPFGTLYRPIDNASVDALVRAERAKRGAQLFSRKDGWAGPIGLLREGGALAVLADQRAGGAGVPAPFFGREVLTTRLPFILHKKTGAPLVPVSARTVAPGKWIIEAHAPIFPGREGMDNRDVFTRHCNHALETALRDSIEDVFWFHRRFRPEANRFFPPPGATASPTPVRRVLVVLPDDPEAARAVCEALDRHAESRPGLALILAGKQLPAGTVHETLLVESMPSPDLSQRVEEMDRSGPVGIDGALLLTTAHLSSWCRGIDQAGIDRVFACGDHPLPRGVHASFLFPPNPHDSSAWQSIFETMSASSSIKAE